MINVTLNTEKNGIELRFDCKPESDVLENLKANGFRWSVKQKMWYAKQNEARMEFVKTLSDVTLDQVEKSAENPVKYDLWGLTRTENLIPHHDFINTYVDGCHEAIKEIAKLIRKEFKKFPMVKASVRVLHRNDINVSIKSSPFEKDSEEIKAICHYIHKFAKTYNYDNSDSMTDYFDVGFYGVCENNMIDYQYKKTEITPETMAIITNFQDRKAAFEKSEEERRERELQEYLKQQEIDAENERIREEIYNKEHESIIAGIDVVGCDYCVLNLIDTHLSKRDTIDQYMNDSTGGNSDRYIAQVGKELHMKKEVYDLFKNHLMDDFDFLANTGGSHTDDLRVQDWIDYQKMSEKERKTVEMIGYNCVAVCCENELRFVIDAQGYSYARYCYLVDDRTEIISDYQTNSGISEEKNNQYTLFAEMLTTTCKEIAENCESSDCDKFKDDLKAWINDKGFPYTTNIVRAVKDGKYKAALYSVLHEYNSIAEQFKRAGLKPEQEFTMIRIDDWFGFNITHGKFKEFSVEKYAQYDNAVKLILRPEGKRKDHYLWLYSDTLIYDGKLEVPENLLWDITHGDVFVSKKSKYGMFDTGSYDAVLEYFNKQGIKPIINTYNL